MSRHHGTHPLILGCDPGVDDGVALLINLRLARLDLRGITTVAGNVGLAQTARATRASCGRSPACATERCPVFRACAADGAPKK